MGCNIHLYTEKKRTINKITQWVNIDNWKKNPYFGFDPDGTEKEYELNPVYKGRNYTLFSQLADVRNSSSNKYISDPKGFPNDASPIVVEQNDRWGDDGHSHSYLTMSEIYDFYEANEVVNHSGLVDENGIANIEKGEMPEWWCQGSSNKSLIYREWQYENTCLKQFIEILEKHFESEYYNKETDANNFRIVFWFDN